ncbi:hypothetical protein [Rheinheimera fenheensis]|uniref:hypothetical protein n=1 Tax=Rheinheimera fenheensis TaxID=3152295 RepID=UPI00325E8758
MQYFHVLSRIYRHSANRGGKHPTADYTAILWRHFSHNSFVNLALFKQKIQRMVGGKQMNRLLRQVPWLMVGGKAL